jgi:hypothetical protein
MAARTKARRVPIDIERVRERRGKPPGGKPLVEDLSRLLATAEKFTRLLAELAAALESSAGRVAEVAAEVIAALESRRNGDDDGPFLSLLFCCRCCGFRLRWEDAFEIDGIDPEDLDRLPDECTTVELIVVPAGDGTGTGWVGAQAAPDEDALGPDDPGMLVFEVGWLRDIWLTADFFLRQFRSHRRIVSLRRATRRRMSAERLELDERLADVRAAIDRLAAAAPQFRNFVEGMRRHRVAAYCQEPGVW